MTHEKLNDWRISYVAARKGGWLERLVRRLTRRFWVDQVRDPINRMYERGLIDSRVYHEAHDYATRVIYATPPPAQPPNAELRRVPPK